jgi:hypothetical protein
VRSQYIFFFLFSFVCLVGGGGGAVAVAFCDEFLCDKQLLSECDDDNVINALYTCCYCYFNLISLIYVRKIKIREEIKTKNIVMRDVPLRFSVCA